MVIFNGEFFPFFYLSIFSLFISSMFLSRIIQLYKARWAPNPEVAGTMTSHPSSLHSSSDFGQSQWGRWFCLERSFPSNWGQVSVRLAVVVLSDSAREICFRWFVFSPPVSLNASVVVFFFFASLNLTLSLMKSLVKFLFSSYASWNYSVLILWIRVS